MCRDWIALVDEIEFESLVWKDRCAAPRTRKSDRGALEQEDSAGLAFRFAHDPEPGLVAADEEGGERLTEHIRNRKIEAVCRCFGLVGSCDDGRRAARPPRANMGGHG